MVAHFHSLQYSASKCAAPLSIVSSMAKSCSNNNNHIIVWLISWTVSFMWTKKLNNFGWTAQLLRKTKCLNIEMNLKVYLIKSFQVIQSFLNLFEPIQTYQNLSEEIWSYRNFSQPIWKYLNLSKPIQTYPNLSNPTLIYPNLSKLIQTWVGLDKFGPNQTSPNLSKAIQT